MKGIYNQLLKQENSSNFINPKDLINKKMKLFSNFKKILSFLPFLDIYERKVEFSVNSKRGVKSRIGGIFSIFLIGVAIYSFVSNLQSWINGEQMRMISKLSSFTLDEVKIKKPTELFDLDHFNYNLYFSIGAIIDSEMPRNTELKDYLTFDIFYVGLDSFHGRKIEWEYCSNKKMDEFLELNQDIQEEIVNPGRICIKDGQNIQMGYAYSNQTGGFAMMMLDIVINKCVNSSENNNSCATQEDIDYIASIATVQISMPKSYYDFNNVTKTRKRSYDYQLYYLDSKLVSQYSVQILPIFLSTDHGLLNTDYKLETVDFNVDTLSYQARSGNEVRLFSYQIRSSFNQQFYYKKNENIFWLVSSLGGTMNFLFAVGNIFILLYNFMLLKHKLINISFSSDEHSSNIEAQTE